MSLRTRYLAAALTLALSLPSGLALASGAGDDQYSDPFGSSQTYAKKKSCQKKSNKKSKRCKKKH